MNITGTATDDVVTGTSGVCISGAHSRELSLAGVNQFRAGRHSSLLFMADLALAQDVRRLAVYVAASSSVTPLQPHETGSIWRGW